MKNKKWITIALVSIFGILSLNFIFLFDLDAYGIRGAKKNKCYEIPNQKYLIVEHLLKDKNDYDTLIFGSSRVGSINPLKIKNKKTYNMTYGEGIPREHLLIIKLLIKHKIPIKHILMGFDDFSYQVKFSAHQNKFIPKSHYLATEKSFFDFYAFYFLRKPSKIDFIHFKRKYLDNKYDDTVCRRAYLTIFQQENIYSNIKHVDNSDNEEYINNPVFSIPFHYSGNDIDNTIEDIKEIVNITKENNITLTLFINPIHHVTYEDTNQKLIKEFRDRLSYISAYYDFSVPNIINNNNENWVETSHFNINVGNMILKRIYDNNQSIENFGNFIKKKDKAYVGIK